MDIKILALVVNFILMYWPQTNVINTCITLYYVSGNTSVPRVRYFSEYSGNHVC